MSFDTEKQKQSSWKIILVEIDLPRDNNILINYQSGIWFREMSRLIPRTNDFSLFGTYAADNPNNTIFRVSSVSVNKEPYLNAGSFATMETTEESYYYNPETTELFIHALNNDNPFLIGDVVLGIVTGYSNTADSDNNIYYNGIAYDPRVLSIPTINKSRDPIFFGKASFPSGKITLNNADGEFDDYKDNNIFGQSIRTLMGFDGLDYDDFRKIATGYIDEFTWDRNKLSLGSKDIRKKLEVSLPTNLYTTTDYPDLQDDDKNKPIPIVYGPTRGGDCTFIEETVASSKYKFKFMDTEFYSATALTTVYIDGVSVSPDSSDLTTATFILDVSVWSGDGEVTADFTGANVTDGFDIAVDLFAKYSNLPYAASVYNTTEWASESAGSMTQAVYINEPKSIIDEVTKIMISDDAQLIPQDDGLLTARIYDEDRTPAKIIPDHVWMGPPKFKQSGTEFLTSVEIKYNKNHATGKFNRYVNRDYEDTVFDTYKKYKQKSIETNLVNSADAIALSNAIMSRASSTPDIVTRTINVEYIDIEIMDMIVANHARASKPADQAVYEVIGRKLKPLSRGETVLSMRRVKDY